MAIENAVTIAPDACTWVQTVRVQHAYMCLSFYSAAALFAMQSAVLAAAIPSGRRSVRLSVHLSVRLTHAGTLSRRMKLGSCGLHCEVAKQFYDRPTNNGLRPHPPKICAQSDPPGNRGLISTTVFSVQHASGFTPDHR